MALMQSFEAKLRRLEEIVEILDHGNEPLDTLVQLYKEGTRLVHELQKMLETAELEVKQLTPSTPEQPPDSPPTDESATS